MTGIITITVIRLGDRYTTSPTNLHQAAGTITATPILITVLTDHLSLRHIMKNGDLLRTLTVGILTAGTVIILTGVATGDSYLRYQAL